MSGLDKSMTCNACSYCSMHGFEGFADELAVEQRDWIFQRCFAQLAAAWRRPRVPSLTPVLLRELLDKALPGTACWASLSA